MANKHTMKILVCSLLFLALFVNMSEAFHFPNPMRPYNVSVHNGIPGGRYLFVHCQSGDNDLGVHRLNPGEVYRFGFHINFQQSTLFHCHAWWTYGTKSFVAFHAGDAFLRGKCGLKECRWQGTTWGIQLHDADKNMWENAYQWDKGRQKQNANMNNIAN